MSNNIMTAFVDIDPEEGIDEEGKKDLEKLKQWENSLPKLNIGNIEIEEPISKIETQDVVEMKIEGNNIIQTKINKKRKRSCFSCLWLFNLW